MIRKLYKTIILFFLFVFLKQNIIAYEYEFVGFIDHDRPRLTDNPASISQMDEDYLEIEPPLDYSRDDVYSERIYNSSGGSGTNTIKYGKVKNRYTG